MDRVMDMEAEFSANAKAAPARSHAAGTGGGRPLHPILPALR